MKIIVTIVLVLCLVTPIFAGRYFDAATNKEMITIPKENYQNIKCLVDTLALNRAMQLGDIKAIQNDMDKQIKIIDNYIKPLSTNEEISLLKGEIFLLKMEILKLQNQLNEFMKIK